MEKKSEKLDPRIERMLELMLVEWRRQRRKAGTS